MKITVAGTGYVGLSNAMLFSKEHEIIAFDIDERKIELLNQRVSPIADQLIQKYLIEAPDSFIATTDPDIAFTSADIVIIATPTNYDEHLNFFDTSSIESVLSLLADRNYSGIVIIKSTIPVGFTEKIRMVYPLLTIIFSPEFLREGKALYDNLYPSRIVIGDKTEVGILIGNLFKNACLKKDVEVLQIDATEAEAVKLFSNTYLAMRVAFFNELDSYCMMRGLNSKDIIDSVCLDPRIGNHYNNPSFGYGGYCLPKDTKQLLANYEDIPQNLIAAIIRSNKTRKDFIAESIIQKKPKTVGIYRLIMKTGSDNFRKSAIQGIIRRLNDENINIVIYEPNLDSMEFHGNIVMNDLIQFKAVSDLIIVNRFTDDLKDVSDKVFTRDIFGEN